jgi:hypothetical protein
LRIEKPENTESNTLSKHLLKDTDELPRFEWRHACTSSAS